MKQILATLLFFISSATFCQVNFEPGFYIDNNGNKTEGFIRNVAWKNNPVEFDFKSAGEGEARTIMMSEAKEFKVGGYRFKRYNLKIERSGNNTNQMATSKDIVWNNETLYLKVLVEGEITLYQYEDGNIVKYFYSNGDHTAVEQLVYKEYVTAGILYKVNQYKQQLYALMKNTLNSMPRFEALKYRKDSLVALFTEYNEAKGTSVTDYTKSQNSGSVNLKFTPGIGFTSLKIGNDMISGDDTSFGGKVTFRIGIEVEYVLPFNNNKWSFFIDPNYQKYNGEAGNGRYMFAADYTFIEIPFGVRHYMFLNDKSKIFLNASYSFDFNLSDSQIQLNAQEPLEITKSSHYALGAGFSYDKFSLEARYNFSRGVLREYPLWGTEFATLNIIAGYKFL